MGSGKRALPGRAKRGKVNDVSAEDVFRRVRPAIPRKGQENGGRTNSSVGKIFNDNLDDGWMLRKRT